MRVINQLLKPTAAVVIVAVCTLAASVASVRLFEFAWKKGWVDLAPIPVLELIIGVPVGLTVGIILARFTVYRRQTPKT